MEHIHGRRHRHDRLGAHALRRSTEGFVRSARAARGPARAHWRSTRGIRRSRSSSWDGSPSSFPRSARTPFAQFEHALDELAPDLGRGLLEPLPQHRRDARAQLAAARASLLAQAQVTLRTLLLRLQPFEAPALVGGQLGFQRALPLAQGTRPAQEVPVRSSGESRLEAPRCGVRAAGAPRRAARARARAGVPPARLLPGVHAGPGGRSRVQRGRDRRPGRRSGARRACQFPCPFPLPSVASFPPSASSTSISSTGSRLASQTSRSSSCRRSQRSSA